MVNTLRFELIFIFLFLPAILFFFNFTVLIFLILLGVFFLTFRILKNDKKFKFTVLKKKIDWIFCLLCFVIFFIGGFIYTLIFEKESIFQLPRENPLLWITILFFYPLISVIPQEFIYRVFFFHRYQSLFNNKIYLIVINLIMFSFAHIVFQNFHAIFITALVSPIFAIAYLQKSFLTCVIIHSFGGQIIFTLGLGKYFF